MDNTFLSSSLPQSYPRTDTSQVSELSKMLWSSNWLYFCNILKNNNQIILHILEFHKHFYFCAKVKKYQ